METLAFIYSAAVYEDTTSCQLRSLDKLGINLSSSAWLGLVGAAVLSILSASDAQAIVQRGDACPAVRDVQNALQRRGYEVGGVDGVFGSQTEYGVLRFQQRNGLNGDRKVDSATAQALGLSGSVYNPGVRCTAAVSNSTNNTTGNTTPRSNPPAGRSTSPAQTPNSNSPRTVTIATNGSALNVRSGPGTNYAVTGALANGTRANTSGRTSGGWIQLASGGWIASSWVGGGSGGGSPRVANSSAPNTTSPSTVSAGQVRVATNGNPLNVRSGPGTNYGVTGVLANGAVANTSGRTSGGWIQLSSGGWISSSWVGARQSGSGTGGGGGSPVRVATNGNPLNARSGPGTNFSVSTVYSNGSSLRTTGRTQGGWVELDNGLWVSSQWIN